MDGTRADRGPAAPGWCLASLRQRRGGATRAAGRRLARLRAVKPHSRRPLLRLRRPGGRRWAWRSTTCAGVVCCSRCTTGPPPCWLGVVRFVGVMQRYAPGRIRRAQSVRWRSKIVTRPAPRPPLATIGLLHRREHQLGKSRGHKLIEPVPQRGDADDDHFRAGRPEPPRRHAGVGLRRLGAPVEDRVAWHARRRSARPAPAAASSTISRARPRPPRECRSSGASRRPGDRPGAVRRARRAPPSHTSRGCWIGRDPIDTPPRSGTGRRRDRPRASDQRRRISRECLVEPRGPFLAGDAERLLLHRLDHPQPERGEGSAAGEHVEARPLLGQQHGIATRGHLDRRYRA